ncbi:polyprenol phosphomannose-dependent alpha 1,6 mannosyltransferase MptB [Frankia sp. CcWB2]
MVLVAGRLALQPGVVTPSRWFGLLDPVPLDRPSPLPAFMIIGVALLVGAWFRLCQRAHQGDLSVPRIGLIIGCWAVPVLLGPPILSLDVYCYTAQGTMLAAGLDPYATGPTALGARPVLLAVDPIWRSALSPYGPVALGYFRLVNALAGGDVLRAVVLHRVVAGASVVVMAVCVVRVSSVARRPWALAFCAGSPIVLLQLVGAIHLEAILLALLVGGLTAVYRGRPVLGLVLITAAALVKWPAALVVVVVLVWRSVRAVSAATAATEAATAAAASVGSGRRAAQLRRVGAVAGRDLAVVASVVVVLSSLVPDGFGWLRVARTPAAGLTLYAPTTCLADFLSVLARMAGSAMRFEDLVGPTRAAGVAVAAGIFVWLLVTVRDREPHATAGLALLSLALLGPVLYPWYLTWGAVLLSLTGQAPRRVLGAVTVVGSFLALPHCELLFIEHPQVAPWFVRQGPIVLLLGLTCGIAVALAARRRPTSVP